MSSTAPIALHAVLAVELAEGSVPARLTLDRDAAETLAAYVAADLAAMLPGVQHARLLLGGALLDPAEVLRPGFPVHAALEELAVRVPRTAAVVAFGSHDGRMPIATLMPDAALRGSALRVLPLVLETDAEHAPALGAALESELAARGEAGALTADGLMRALGAHFAHARYLTQADLLALVCVQYEHRGLAPFWQLIEAALLTPDRVEATLSPRGLRCRWDRGTVRIETPAAWMQHRDHADDDAAHAYAGAVFELRQAAALAGAHGLALAFDAAEGDAALGYAIETSADPRAELGVPQLVAHSAPGLGVVAITAVQAQPGGAHLLAIATPLRSDALPATCAALAARYAAAVTPQHQPRLLLDANGRPAVVAGPVVH